MVESTVLRHALLAKGSITVVVHTYLFRDSRVFGSCSFIVGDFDFDSVLDHPLVHIIFPDDLKLFAAHFAVILA